MINWVKYNRVNVGLTQSELGYLCSVSTNTIGSIERGEYHPGVLLYLRLCAVFWSIDDCLPDSYDLDQDEISELNLRMEIIRKRKAVGKSSKAPQGKVTPGGKCSVACRKRGTPLGESDTRKTE